jgi:PhoPQ-activated pathogenicity-related protein
MRLHSLRTAAAALLAFAIYSARADLATYVSRPEPKASWSVVGKQEAGSCEITILKLTSQVWQDIPWEHDLVLFRPKGADVTDKMYLLNNGGSIRQGDLQQGVTFATMTKAPVAALLGIPKQPLFEGKREDDLIAETFVRFLDTKDPNWPLLFPMVKSLVKAMDAIQEFTAKEWSKKIESFAVGGASKRGWTSWLTAAVDPRVIAITPMVIDVLKMTTQMEHQVACFGEPSEQIRPYVARGLVPIPDTAEARRLWEWIDPWTYRAKFTMPKLVVLGNNDRYWAPDALNIYWDALPGAKWINYTPNAGHNLSPVDAQGKRGAPTRALQAAAAFVRHQFTGRAMPELSWKHDDAGDKLRLSVEMKPSPKSITVWQCSGPTKDLRNARWNSRAAEVKDGKTEIVQPRPSDGVICYYADCEYEIDGIPFNLCTQLRMVASDEPAATK